MTIIVTLVVVLLFLAIGLPVALSLVLGGSIGLLVWGGPDLLSGILSTGPGSAISSYELLTVPMFLLMAEFMVISKISDTLFNAISTWTSRLRGGLGISTALTGAAFGAISGSSTASAATLSISSIPFMISQGYNRRYASGIVAISGTLAMLIPPSIAVILYGLLSGEDIGKLLIAGIIPGALVGLTIIFTSTVQIILKPSLVPKGYSSSWREKVMSLKVAGPFIILFILVTGLIYLGIATPVESSAIGAAGAFIMTLCYGKMGWRNFAFAVVRACMTSAMIGLIIVCAHVYGTFLTMTGATQDLIAFVTESGFHPYVVLAIICALYLMLGCFLDLISIMILTVPILLPLIQNLGFNGIWFGMIVILLGEIGIVTPPVGLNVFVVSRATGVPVGEVFSGVWPHVFSQVLLVILLIVLPGIVMWVPSHMTGH
ncbi:MAG: TRAP transporter large permease [Deltaproteobacteria bacterium]|nr:TRAP transporter large permease [Deltaproteobacteria bacterium]